MWIGAGVFIAALVVAVFVLGALNGDDGAPQRERPDYRFGVQTFPDLGRLHIAAGETFDGYNSNPPTSGPHGPVATFGVHDEAVPRESAVHNMEHGGVVVWYNCAGSEPLDDAACTQLRDSLAAVVQGAVERERLVLMTPYTAMSSRIALTAWQTLDEFDEFDAARVDAFIESFERKFNPEEF